MENPALAASQQEAKPLANAWTELPSSFYHSFLLFSCRINRVFLPSGLLRALQLLLLWALWHRVELHFFGCSHKQEVQEGCLGCQSGEQQGEGTWTSSMPGVNSSKKVYWGKKCVEQPVWLWSVYIHHQIKHLPSTTGLWGLGRSTGGPGGCVALSYFGP